MAKSNRAAPSERLANMAQNNPPANEMDEIENNTQNVLDTQEELKEEKISNDEVKSETHIPITQIQEEVKNEHFIKAGKVANCSTLNVRQTPKADGKVITSIPVNKLVTITDNSDSSFYKVSYVDGNNNQINGYCKKEFITIPV